jgi:hypothetical protein
MACSANTNNDSAPQRRPHNAHVAGRRSMLISWEDGAVRQIRIAREDDGAAAARLQPPSGGVGKPGTAVPGASGKGTPVLQGR